MLNYMGKLYYKYLADGGFLSSKAPVTTTVLRDALKISLCVCGCVNKEQYNAY
jgi:hypothetical protein